MSGLALTDQGDIHQAAMRWRAILNASPSPSLLLDRRGRILARNQGGANLLERHPAVYDHHGALGFRRDDEAKQFINAEHDIAADPTTPVVITLLARVGMPVLLLRLMAVDGFAAGDVLCTMEDLTAEISDISRLARVMGLTLAQARTAALLAKGLSVPEICERFGVQAATLRTHIGSAKGKLGLDSQQELAVWTARIARFAGLLDTPR